MNPRYIAKIRIDEISAVDRPAQTPARAVLIKRAAQNEQPAEGAAPGLQKGTNPGGITSNPPNNTMTAELQKQIDESKAQVEQLTKRAERAERLASLSDVQKAHLNALPAEQQEPFLALEPKAREQIVTAAVAKSADSNPIVETIDGEPFRKNDDPRMLKMAKQIQTERAERLKVEKQARSERLTKRAGEELNKLPGKDLAKVALLDVIEMHLPAEHQAEVAGLIKAANSGLAKAFETNGTREGVKVEGEAAAVVIERVTKRLMTENPKLSKLQAMEKAADDPEVKAAYQSR